jgi:ubiquinone/menaquinone biosynthesis C-methylase UbiE
MHSFVSVPVVYDLVQWAAGAAHVHAKLSRHVAQLPYGEWIVDVGGGTGALKRLFTRQRHYVCLDLDLVKLRAVRRKGPQHFPVLGDATHLPFATGVIDTLLCSSVSHHLSDLGLQQGVRELHRVLRPNGTLLFMDAVWHPSRWRSRLLWRYDRGTRPRSAAVLQSALLDRFEIRRSERVMVHHEYLIAVCSPRPFPNALADDAF